MGSKLLQVNHLILVWPIAVGSSNLLSLQANIHMPVLNVLTHRSGQLVIYQFSLTQPPWNFIFHFLCQNAAKPCRLYEMSSVPTFHFGGLQRLGISTGRGGRGVGGGLPSARAAALASGRWRRNRCNS